MSPTAHESADAIGVRLFDTTEGRRNPYPLYHELRKVEPVHRSSLGMWFLTRYDDIAAMLRDPRFGKNFEHQMSTTIGPDWRQHSAATNQEASLLNVDGPAHTRLRRRVIGAFKKRAIDSLRPSIERTVESLLVPFGEAGGGDLMETIAFPLPVAVIGEILGVPEADRPQFRELVADLVAIFELKPTSEMLARADEADATIRGYFLDLIAEKRKTPDDAVLSELIHGGEDDLLDDDEIARMALLLFAAGFETTTSLIGNTMWGLLQHPDQIQRLRAEPDRFEQLPDEALRYDGTAQAVSRFTMDEVEVGGFKIPAGETVLGLLGAGNHDPEEFENPDAFDVTREKFRPLSFGGGIHFCLGAQLAKAEIEITFREILERFDSIDLSAGPPRFRDRLILRGPETLHLSCTVADRVARTSAPARPATVTAAPVGLDTSAASNPGAVRPSPRPGTDDSGWRNALRSKVEGDAAGEAIGWVRSGNELVTTIVQLARCRLFHTCTSEQIEGLAVTSYPISFEPGDRLTVEGAESLDCYVIVEGEADVFIDGEKVNEVDENDVVGERGPLMNEERSATVVATEHLVAYAISRERLLGLVASSPTAAEGMYAFMKERYGA